MKSNSSLGRLERVELRDIWETEAQDFTPWLAKEENLKVLADTINMDLGLEAQEKSVGPFRADILCKNTDDGSWVLIENQLERTDHNHLGQLLTYAAGLHTVTVVWVAATFTDEHRATLDWLNDITDDSFRFFGLEVELWRIGDSPAAPKFNIVSKPNDWSRSVSQAARRIGAEALTETTALQLEYWASFRDYLQQEDSPIRPQKPFPQNWMNFGVGRTGFVLTVLLISTEKQIAVDITMNDENAKAYFALLRERKEEIEAALGLELVWMELPERKSCRLVHYWRDVDPLDKERWPEYREWMRQHLEKLNEVFRPRVKTLNAADWAAPSEAEVAG